MTAAAALVVLGGRGRVERPVETGGHGLGLLLVEQGDGLSAELAAADSVEHVVQGKGGVGAGQGDLFLLGHGKCQAQVLQEVLDHKARLPVAHERLGRQRVHGAGAARAAQDHLAGLVEVEAGLLGKGERVGHAHHGGRERDLVGELCRLALAGSAKAVDLGGERLEDRADGLDVGLGRADDQRERARDGAGVAAGDRAVKGVLAVGLGRLGDIARELGGAGSEVDQVGAGLGSSEQTVAGKINLLDVGRVAHHGKHHVGVLGGLSRAIGPDGTAGNEVVGLGLGAVVDAHGVASVQDVPGDGRAHDAGADECDLELLLCHKSLFSDLRVSNVRLSGRCFPAPLLGLLAAADALGDTVGERDLVGAVLAPEHHGHHARAHVRAQRGTH